jgi:hypothetical protein
LQRGETKQGTFGKHIREFYSAFYGNPNPTKEEIEKIKRAFSLEFYGEE